MRLEVCGPAADVADFVDSLGNAAPPQARVDSVEIKELPPISAQALSGATFEIRAAAGDALPQPTIPANLATCDACREEIAGPNQRRYRYPFTNCTNCGPRWSIIRQLPYDRPRTSMAQFPMCAACQAEYDDPADRRFHAQPVACPRCGPHLRLLDAQGWLKAEGDQALQAAAEALAAGQVMALQGLGGFQLLVDATDAPAVDRLRRRKHRPDRPFALMFPSLQAVRRCCLVSEAEARELLSPAAPILLLRRTVAVARTDHVPRDEIHHADRDEYGDIALNVAPGNPYLGAMLPYTPLHHLLLEAVARPLVCTSGNLSEEPMAIEIDDALQRLGGLSIADLFLVHDRPIVRPVDDSVARVGPDGLQILRRARGFAPLPIQLNFAAPPILAVGGHLKNTVALAVGGQSSASVVLSQHIGDLESSLSLSVFRRAIDDLLEFLPQDRKRWPAICTPIMLRLAMPKHWPAGFRFPSCACSTITPTWRRAWRSMVWRVPCWGSPGTARATVQTARFGAAKPSCAAVRTIIAWPICEPSPYSAAIGQPASRAGRRWGCCMK